MKLCMPARSMMLLLGAFGVARAQSIQTVPEWRLAPTARVSIGVADGDERYMFREIVGALRTRGGNIVIADGEAPLKMFDTRGTFVRPIGGRGSGPGEVRHVIDPPFPYRGDSIALWDVQARRLAVFDSAGHYGRTAVVLIPRVFWPAGTIPSESCCRMRHAYGDGSALLEFPAMIPNGRGANRHATKALVRVSADGARSDTLGTFEDGWYRYDANAPSLIRNIRLSNAFMYTMVGDTVFGGNGSGQWLLRITPGSKPDTVKLAGTPVRITDAVKAEYAQAWRDARKANPERFEGSVESLFEGEYADFLPAYTQIHSDPAGNLWLAQWKLPFSKAPREYHIYSSRGRPLGRIKLPAMSMIAFFGPDHIGLIESDADGIQYLRTYDVISPRLTDPGR